MRNGVQLITYVDRFGLGDLSTIRELLNGPLQDVFTGVHLLPFYRPYDGADAGFDPIDHRLVDPRLGDWDRVRAISETHDVTADLIVNHISDESPQFQEFLEKGSQSAYEGMFLEYDSVFPRGASQDQILKIYRPRPQLPFTVVTLADGSRKVMWTTFTPHQIDLDIYDPRARQYLEEILDRLALAGVTQVRLDAIGYAVKTANTTSFMTPETMHFIDDIGASVRARGMEALLEIHSHYSDQLAAAERVDRVYDFALPPLVLHALYTGLATPLGRWLEIRPRNAVTVLDTHDGIGIVDVGPRGEDAGLLTTDELEDLVEGIHAATGGQSRLSTGASASNLDLYQVNSTYFSALGGDENRYLLARLIQFLLPGIPQVYYAGLVAAENEMGLLARTGVGRDINRPYLRVKEIEESLERPVVRRLMGLAKFRNRHPAFGGEFGFSVGAAHVLNVAWRYGSASIEAMLDLKNGRFGLTHSFEEVTDTISDWDGF